MATKKKVKKKPKPKAVKGAKPILKKAAAKKKPRNFGKLMGVGGTKPKELTGEKPCTIELPGKETAPAAGVDTAPDDFEVEGQVEVDTDSHADDEIAAGVDQEFEDEEDEGYF